MMYIRLDNIATVKISNVTVESTDYCEMIVLYYITWLDQLANLLTTMCSFSDCNNLHLPSSITVQNLSAVGGS